MTFIKKTWLARLGTGLNKFTVNGGSNKVALDSAPDTITQEGTPLSAQNMNDLEGRIETAFTGVNADLTNLAGNFAQIETTPSTHNYSVGDMLVFNGILYKVITAIATNDALVVGSNIEAQTVASEIMMNIIKIKKMAFHTDTPDAYGNACLLDSSNNFILKTSKVILGVQIDTTGSFIGYTLSNVSNNLFLRFNTNSPSMAPLTTGTYSGYLYYVDIV